MLVTGCFADFVSAAAVVQLGIFLDWQTLTDRPTCFDAGRVHADTFEFDLVVFAVDDETERTLAVYEYVSVTRLVTDAQVIL